MSEEIKREKGQGGSVKYKDKRVCVRERKRER